MDPRDVCFLFQNFDFARLGVKSVRLDMQTSVPSGAEVYCIDNGTPIGVAKGQVQVSNAAIMAHGVLKGNYSSGRGTSGACVMTKVCGDLKLLGVHLGAVGRSEYPNVFVPSTVLLQLYRAYTGGDLVRDITNAKVDAILEQVASVKAAEDLGLAVSEAGLHPTVWKQLRATQFTRRRASKEIRAMGRNVRSIVYHQGLDRLAEWLNDKEQLTPEEVDELNELGEEWFREMLGGSGGPGAEDEGRTSQEYHEEEFGRGYKGKRRRHYDESCPVREKMQHNACISGEDVQGGSILEGFFSHLWTESTPFVFPLALPRCWRRMQ